MKKLVPVFLMLSLLVCSCGQKKNVEEEVFPQQTENTEDSQNPYVSDTEAEDAVVIEEDLSGELITITASEFIERITEINNPKGFSYKGRTPCIVDFYADWCSPCIQFKPILAEMAQKYKGKVIIYKINVDRAQDVCEAFGIQNIPTLMFFSRTEQPRKIVGSQSRSEIDRTIRDFIGE